MRLLRRTFLGFLILIVALLLLGFLYQTVSAGLDRRKFPPLGQLIDIGGRKIHMVCQGEGSPTVILEAMSDGTSAYWGLIQPQVAAQTRVCSYDRAGRGWSDPAPGQRTGRAIAEDLHAALVKSGAAGPYVLVGHSAGGLFALEYTHLYPEEVVGLLLLDAVSAQQDLLDPGFNSEINASQQMMQALRIGSYFGLTRLISAASAPGAQFPQAHRGAIMANYATPRYWQSVLREVEVRLETNAEARLAGDLGSLPVRVVSATVDLTPAWEGLQSGLTQLSTNARRVSIPGATHTSLLFDPEHAQAVSQYILDLTLDLR